MIQRLIDGIRQTYLTPATDGGPIPTRELLTDEENVIRTLREHAGVTWQSHIVAETDWSESKVSRVLCSMEDDGMILRYRVGRQNVVSLPGCEPECLKEDYDPLAN